MKRTKLLKTMSLEKLMDLKVDFAFKQLFGIEKNKDITIAFLNAVLQKTGRERIIDISFSNTETSREYKEDKQSRLDLLVVTQAEEWINVEIQFTNKYDTVNRSIYYWAGIYRTPIEKNMTYKELKPVIAINILNFNLFNQTERFHTTYHLYEDNEQFKLTDVMEFHFIEMTKLIRDWQAEKLDPWDDVLARWLLMLGMVDRRNGKVHEDIFNELEAIAMKDETLQEAFENWEKLSGTREEMLAYEGRLKRMFDEEAFVREMELRKQEIEQRKQEIEQRNQEVEQRNQEVEQRNQEVEQRNQEVELRIQEVQEAELRAQEAELRAQEVELQAKEMEEERMEKGRKKGVEQGIKLGLKEEKNEVTRRLLEKGVERKVIVEITGLAEEEISRISKEIESGTSH